MQGQTAVRLILLLSSCTVLESFTLPPANPTTAFWGRLYHLALREKSAYSWGEHKAVGVGRVLAKANRPALPILQCSPPNSESGWEEEMQGVFQSSPLDFNGTAVPKKPEPEPEHISEVFARSPLCASSEGKSVFELADENTRLKAALEASRAETAALQAEVKRLERELGASQLSLKQEMDGIFSAKTLRREDRAREAERADESDVVLDEDLFEWEKEVGWEDEIKELFAGNPLTSGKRYAEEDSTPASEEKEKRSTATGPRSEEVQLDIEDEILQLFDGNPLTSGRRYEEEERGEDPALPSAEEGGEDAGDATGWEGEGGGERGTRF